MTTLEDLEKEAHDMAGYDPDYWKKQMHRVPKSQVLDRTIYLQAACKDKIALHIGCDGPLDALLNKEAKKLYGIDKGKIDREDFIEFDLDTLAHEKMPIFEGVEVIICGEVLEHLSNPGWFLKRMKEAYPGALVVFTVPNATAFGLVSTLKNKGYECVNPDHVCWYSYTTMRTLLGRFNYSIEGFYWYNGKPFVAEGLIILAR